MITIKERLNWSTRQSKVLAKGATLKEACKIWESLRDNNDDLWNAFKKSKFFTKDFDYENVDSAYFNFLESLTGEEMFNIMRDGKLTFYEGEEEND